MEFGRPMELKWLRATKQSPIDSQKITILRKVRKVCLGENSKKSNEMMETVPVRAPKKKDTRRTNI